MMNPTELKTILDRHATWLRGESSGARADLRGADLRSADLRGADLRGADLRSAVLRSAVLRSADLTGADLRSADLRGADLTGADLRSADLRSAVLRSAVGLPDAPVVPDIDRAILRAIESGGKLNMGAWHSCETTHCRAGWAIHLAGEPGYALENKFGSAVAGELIYRASRPGVPTPDFYATDDDALEDIRKCAQEAA